MSTIRLLIIKGNTLYSQECPWRTAIKVINSNKETLHRFLRLVKSKQYLDAGYLLMDTDNHILISNHQAFTIQDLKPSKKEQFNSWDIIEPL